MKQQRIIVEKVAMQLVKKITEQEVNGWPPVCVALCYQPLRPKYGTKPEKENGKE